MSYDKKQPQATEIEPLILGAILIDSSAIDTVKLETDDFYNPKNQIVYKACKQLKAKNSAIDMFTVANELTAMKELNNVGGVAYIAQLTEHVVSAMHLKTHCQIVLQKSIQRQMIKKYADILEKSYNSEIDIADLLTDNNKLIEQIHEAISKGTGNIASFENQIDNELSELSQKCTLAKQGKILGIETPLTLLTKYLGGFVNSELTVIAGRPAMGKTSFVLACLRKAAMQGKSVVVFSLEMRAESLIGKLLCAIASINPNNYKNGYLGQTEWQRIEQAAQTLRKNNITIIDKGEQKFSFIQANSRLLKKKGKCDMIIIDYLQLAKMDGKTFNRENEVSEMSASALNLAKELNVPVLLLSQLSRANESRPDKRPQLSDLRDSGAIEQNANNVLFIHRESYYTKDTCDNTGEIIIAKNRAGETGTVKFNYDAGLLNITDYYEN